MSPYFLLLPVLVVDILGAWLTYSHRSKEFYSPAMMAVGGATAGLWAYGVILCRGNGRMLFLFGFLFMILEGLYLLPPLLFDVRASWMMGVGITLVVVGSLLVKLAMDE